MKYKYLILSGAGLIIVLSAFFLIRFTQSALSPSETVSAFHKNARAMNIPKTEELVANDIVKGFANGAFPQYGSFGGFLTDYHNHYKSVKPIQGTEKIDGDSASVKANIIYNNGMKKTDTYQLIKEDGRWKIAK